MVMAGTLLEGCAHTFSHEEALPWRSEYVPSIEILKDDLGTIFRMTGA